MELHSHAVSEINQSVYVDAMPKRLGLRKGVTGSGIPSSLLQNGYLAIELKDFAAAGDGNYDILNVSIGQVHAFHRYTQEGIRPDAPRKQVIHPVVQEFRLQGVASLKISSRFGAQISMETLERTIFVVHGTWPLQSRGRLYICTGDR